MANPGTNAQESGLLVTGDLIFSTKITGTAAALGLALRVVPTMAAALEQLRAGVPGCVIVDLALPESAPGQLGAIVAAAGGRPVLAFGSHVDTERLEAARQAGCAAVLPRSRFASSLPELLEQHCRG